MSTPSLRPLMALLSTSLLIGCASPESTPSPEFTPSPEAVQTQASPLHSAGIRIWYRDWDGDGYGGQRRAKRSRTQPPGFVANRRDCHDNDPTAYPGSHATEVPFDSIDQDCDGKDVCTDLNCDGYTDLVFANEFWDLPNEPSAGVDSSIFWGGPTGYSPTDRTDLPTTLPESVDAADLDGDGYIDLVFGNKWDKGQDFADVGTTIFWGSADGFDPEAATDLSAPGADLVLVEDLDEDGFPDILIGGGTSLDNTTYAISGESFIYWGSSDGYSELDRSELDTCSGWKAPLIADLNGDGWRDLAFACNLEPGVMMSEVDGFWTYTEDFQYGSSAPIFWGSSAGFDPVKKTDLPTTGASAVAVADLDDDGHPDVVFSNMTDDSVDFSVDSTIYWGAAGGFDVSQSTALPTEGIRTAPVIEDLDGDGVLDILMAGNIAYEDDAVNYAVPSYIYRGGDGFSVDSRIELPTVRVFGDPEVADLDGDGHLDVVFPHYYVQDENGSNSTEVDSRIYWGTGSGFDATNFTALPTHAAIDVLVVGD